jgi:hypothetical protein
MEPIMILANKSLKSALSARAVYKNKRRMLNHINLSIARLQVQQKFSDEV